MPATQVHGELICLGVIAGVRGLRGDLWIKSFTADPAAIAGYGPLFDETGRRTFILRVVGSHKDRLIGRIDGVEDRTRAEALKGIRLHVPRAALPEPEDDEFYHADLVGLRAVLAGDARGEPVGRVRAVHEVGDTAMLEIGGDAFGTAMVPFSRDAVPEIDLEAGTLVVTALPVEPAEDGTRQSNKETP